MSIRQPILVVGGGLSGLSAAVTLCAAGAPVRVLEQRPYAGGRAYSFRDRETGETIDNGQHLLLAGYHRTRAFLQTIGSAGLVTVQKIPSFTFHHPERGFGRLQLPRLPAPWHLVVGVLRFGILPLRERLGILRAGVALSAIGQGDAAGPGDQTILEWLRAQRQRPEAIRSFWEPLAVSIMNERIETAAAGPFLRALAGAFLLDPGDAAAMLPAVGLSRLFVDGARDYIASHGGEVRCGAEVATVRVVNKSAVGVLLRNGLPVDGDGVVLAVPWHEAHALRPEIPDDPPPVSSPILSIHLWFENDFMPEPFLGLIGRRVQWIFNRRRFAAGERKGGHLSAVISAAHDVVGMSNSALIAMAMEDVRSAYGACPVTPLRAVVIREKRATYSSSPATERVRPGPATGVRNLALAGDWTNTGLPATIEGAVISGERAALHLLREFGILKDAERQADPAR